MIQYGIARIIIGRIFCRLKTIYYMFKHPLGFNKDEGLIYISGHDYIENKDSVLVCEACGKRDKE